MSDDVDAIKKYLDSIGSGDIPVQKGVMLTESALSDKYGSHDDGGPAEELMQVAEQIEELVEEAESILRELGPEARAAVSRAKAYWIPQILGTIALNSTSTSMHSMADTIEELKQFSGEEDYEDGYANDGIHSDRQ